MRCVIRFLVVSATGALANAQTTWIVDSQNAPGTNFLDIPPAVAAASDGDRIVIRGRGLGISGTVPYTAPTVDGKGLTFLREGSLPAQVNWVWNIRNLLAHQTVLLIGLQLGRPGGAAGLAAANNRGLLILDRLVTEFNWGESGFTDCNLVMITRSDIWGSSYLPITATRSRVVVYDSQLRGFQWLFGGGAGGPLKLVSSTAWLMNTYLEGVWGTASFPNFNTPAIQVENSELFLGPGTVVYGGQDFGGGLRRVAISDPGPLTSPTSVVHHDPNEPIVLDSVPQFNLAYGPVSSLRSAETTSTLSLIQRAVPTSATLLVAGGLVTTPWISILGPAYIDPNTVQFVDLRIAPSGGYVTRAFAIPPGLPPGFRLAFQGAELTPANVLSTTNPVVFGVW